MILIPNLEMIKVVQDGFRREPPPQDPSIQERRDKSLTLSRGAAYCSQSLDGWFSGWQTGSQAGVNQTKRRGMLPGVPQPLDGVSETASTYQSALIGGRSQVAGDQNSSPSGSAYRTPEPVITL